MDFIEELYYGNINPNLKYYKNDSEYSTAMSKFCSCEDKLNELLDGKELKIFIDLINANDEITAVSDVENFKNGFKLGVRMICDSLILDKKSIFRDID